MPDAYMSTPVFVLVRILMAHVLADFVFQPDAWIEDRAKRKAKSPYLYLHILIVGLLTWLFIQPRYVFVAPLVIMMTHGAIDIFKTYLPDNTRNFLIDQFAHILIIVLVWGALISDLHPFLYTIKLIAFPSLWIVLLSYIIAIWPASFVIAKFTQKWREDIDQADDYDISGLEDAGKWIGRIERFLILTLILINQYSAIGFLIASKSIFRFSGIEKKQVRKEAEYILIGTLISFALAIILGLATKYLLNAI